MAKQPNEDLFEGTTMTFGEHLDELRVVLFRSLIGLLICVILGFLVAKQVVKKIQGPLRTALETYYLKQAKDDLAKKYDGTAPVEMVNLIEERGMIPDPAFLDIEMLVERLRYQLPDEFSDLRYKRYQYSLGDFPPAEAARFCAQVVAEKDDAVRPASVVWKAFDDEQKNLFAELADLEELNEDQRRRLLAAMNQLIEVSDIHTSQPFQDFIAKESFESQLSATESKDLETTRRLNRLLMTKAFSDHIAKPQPLIIEAPLWKPITIRVQTLNAHEAFMIWLKAAFLAGLVMASPWIFFQVWSFVGAGLYPHEKKYVYLYLPFSLILFLAGASMAFFFVFEHVLNFLFSFNAAMEIDPDPRISEWLSFVLLLPVGFGIAFQLPLGMLFLYRLGIFSIEAYLSKWRIAILIIFVLSMLLTPADPISMMLMAVPLTILYFLGILLCHWVPRNRNPFREGYDPS